MNKTDLIDTIAKDCDLSKAAAQRALDSFMSAVVKAVTEGNTVQLVGFGSFSSGKRAARTGRNPHTGEEIAISAVKTDQIHSRKDIQGCSEYSE